MKKFVILILIALLFVWIAKMPKTPEISDRMTVKPEYSAAVSTRQTANSQAKTQVGSFTVNGKRITTEEKALR